MTRPIDTPAAASCDRPRTRETLLRLTRVKQVYGDTAALLNIDFSVARGEFVALVGPSGCGKTTILNLCAGWLAPSAGTVERPARVRMIFQEGGLFPWLTAAENVQLGLATPCAAAERARRTERLLALVGATGFERHYPHQLSGGLRQRVELARALGDGTDLLLMDEPFSSLDYLTRLRLRNELARVLAAQPRTVLFVTHDIVEAAQLADRVLVLSERPATIRGEIVLTPPRPRTTTQSEVVAAAQRIMSAMGVEPELVEPPAAGAAGFARRGGAGL